MRPYIVDKNIDEHSEIITKIQPKVLRTISNKKSLDTLKTFLKDVVEDGTAQKTRVKFLDVAGKTGTAEKAINGKYSKDKYTSLFAGFFPVKNPQYAMVVVYDEANYENKKYYASQSAVPTFKNIIIDIANLPQSNLGNSKKMEENTFVTAPNLVNLSKSDALELLHKSNLNFEIIGNANTVSEQFPKPNISYPKDEIIYLFFDELPSKKHDLAQNIMPNLIGLTIGRAIEKANFNLSIEGSGIIVQQSIQNGTKINFNSECLVKAKL